MASEYLAVIPNNTNTVNSSGSLTVSSKGDSTTCQPSRSSACQSQGKSPGSTKDEENKRQCTEPLCLDTYATTPGLDQSTGNDVENPAITDAQARSLNMLSVCRKAISVLEITRMQKSRLGFVRWQSFWERIYLRPYARRIIAPVRIARVQIDHLFRFIAAVLQRCTQQTAECVLRLKTEDAIRQSMELLETTVGNWRQVRRQKAQEILNRMRASIEAIPIAFRDGLFVDLKRGVFALDAACDYHPGDPATEDRERRFKIRIYPAGTQRLVMSPRFYREWQEAMIQSLAVDVRNSYARETGQDIGENWMDGYFASDEESSTSTSLLSASGGDGARQEDDGAGVEQG